MSSVATPGKIGRRVHGQISALGKLLTQQRTWRCGDDSRARGSTFACRWLVTEAPMVSWRGECAFESPAGVPKDGNRADQRFHTGSLVVEGRFELTPLG